MIFAGFVPLPASDSYAKAHSGVSRLGIVFDVHVLGPIWYYYFTLVKIQWL